MGTRGTLRVFINGELKLRQYNQWDSYPDGQFKDICDFVIDEHLLEMLTDVLGNSRFMTKDEWLLAEAFADTGGCPKDSIHLVTAMNYMVNRDFGSKILYTIASMLPIITPAQPIRGEYIIPDWAVVFDTPDLEPEEGNYTLHITADESDGPYCKEYSNIRFELGGSWHDVARDFNENCVPSDGDIEAWKQEAERKWN